MATRLIHNLPRTSLTLLSLSMEEIRDRLHEGGLSEDLIALRGVEVRLINDGVVEVISIHSRLKREGEGYEYAMRTLTLTLIEGHGWEEEVTWSHASEEDYKRLTSL